MKSSVHGRLALALLLWAALIWGYARPDHLVQDSTGWRQSDTQTIAYNSLRQDAEFNVPLVNWGGATKPVAAETEFQLYTTLVAQLLRLDREAEWPGQLISLLSLLVAAAALFYWLRDRFGAWAAWLGLAAFMCSRAFIFMASKVQPDGMALAFLVLGWIAFDRWLTQPRWRQFILWVALISLSSLMKITNLQIGIAMALLVAMTQPQRLFSGWLWLGWAFILLCNVMQLAHGAAIFEQTGITFGIASGGDSKFPRPSDLLKPGHYLAITRMSFLWGVSVVGGVALIVLALQRKLSSQLLPLLIAHGMALVIAMRYTITDWLGPHYHAPGALIGAIAVALLAARLAERYSQKLIGGVLLAAMAVSAVANLQTRVTLGRSGESAQLVQLAADARARIQPGSAVVVRSPATRQVLGWGNGPNNFEDPRLFWELRSTGWVLAWDDSDTGILTAARDAGAEWVIDPWPASAPPAVQRWLDENVVERHHSDAGAWYRLRARPPADTGP